MDNLLKKFFASSLVTSITLLLLGLLLIFQSEITIISISYIIGGILIALGILGIIKFIKDLNNEYKEELNIVYGVVTIILGILVIKNPHAIASILPIVIGIGIIINSATKLQYAFELKAINNSLWKSTLIISIIGVILLFNPFKGAVFLTKIVGILIALYAILDIISTFSIRNNVREIHKTLEETIKDADVIEEKEDKKETKDKKKSKKRKSE